MRSASRQINVVRLRMVSVMIRSKLKDFMLGFIPSIQSNTPECVWLPWTIGIKPMVTISSYLN